MYTFLFDILPDAGHIRITLKLSAILHERGYEVYYTNTSDSVFTSGLLEKGIGRILYPDDLRWFIPNLVLLDYELKEKMRFYRERNIKYIFVAMQLLNNVTDNDMNMPVVYLPPSGSVTIPLESSDNDEISGWLAAMKEDKDNILIIGLLEEGIHPHKLYGFYEAIRKSCITNTQYKVILLTNSERNTMQLFSLPNNMAVYRLVDLPAVLPLCDVALIAGDLNTMIEGVYANVPAVVYPSPVEMKYEHRIKQYIKHGLGVYSEVEKITPERFEQQITQILLEKKKIRERLMETKYIFEDENLKMEEMVDWLVGRIKIDC